MCLLGHSSAPPLFFLIVTLEFDFGDEEEGLLFKGGCHVAGWWLYCSEGEDYWRGDGRPGEVKSFAQGRKKETGKAWRSLGAANS